MGRWNWLRREVVEKLRWRVWKMGADVEDEDEGDGRGEVDADEDRNQLGDRGNGLVGSMG